MKGVQKEMGYLLEVSSPRHRESQNSHLSAANYG